MKLVPLHNTVEFEDLELLSIKAGQKMYGRVVSSIANGFPSPAEDFSGEVLSLDEKYLSKPESTYFAKAKGLSNYPTICPGDLMVIRADIQVNDGDLAVVSFNNSKFSTKRVDLTTKKLYPDNSDFGAIEVGDDDVVVVMGKIHAIIRENLTKK